MSATPPLGARLVKMLHVDALPKAQYIAFATEKNVDMTIA